MDRRTLLKLIPLSGMVLSSIAKSYGEQKANDSLSAGSYHLSRIAEMNPQLAKELSLLPEIRNGISPIEEKGLENLMMLYEIDRPRFNNILNSMLQIGIPKYRHYCSPLQALFWLCLDDKISDAGSIVSNYRLVDLLRKSWRDPINKQDERWSDFRVVVNRLNAPELVFYYAQFLKNTWKHWNAIPTLEETFKLKDAVGWQEAALLVYCLEQGGYQNDGFSTCCMKFSMPWDATFGAVYKNLQKEWFYVGGSYKFRSAQFKQEHFKDKTSMAGIGPYGSLYDLCLNVLVPEDKKEWTGGAATYKTFTSDELRLDFYKAKR